MIPSEVVKNIDEIKTPSNRVLVIVLILAIIALAGWGLALTKSNTANQKAALIEVKKECAEQNKIRDEKISALERKLDSVFGRQFYDNQQTITLFRQMLEKSRVINNKIRHQK